MRIALCACLMLAAASLALARQFDSKTGADENHILAFENALNGAQRDKDTKVLQELLADAFVYTNTDGNFFNKAEFLKDVSSPGVHLEQITTESTTVHSFGNVAIVTGIEREKGTLAGKSFTRRSRFTDIWMSQNGVWQCVAAQSTLIARQ
ncbi:MAG TPA: nuclear transport factor 2 family protein [Candidatus Limnocylindrales bacterium]|nr:nuclear transport factor 2 family protein [Candidatus Limnocylindrales bacterium]